MSNNLTRPRTEAGPVALRTAPGEPFLEGFEGAAHTLERFDQGRARATKVETHEPLATGAKGAAIVQAYTGLAKKELVGAARNARPATVEPGQVGTLGAA